MALTEEELGLFGVLLLAALAPWSTPSLEIACAAIAALGFNTLLELFSEVGSEGEPGWVCAWGKLLDPDAEPFPGNPTLELARLRYLGQYVGVEVPYGVPVAEARALLYEKAGTNRGTDSAVGATLTRTLPGGATFILLKRVRASGEPNPGYAVVAITGVNGAPWEEAEGTWITGAGSWESEGPVSRAREAVAQVKYEGIVLEWLVSSGQTWFNDTGPWETSTRTWAESLLPGE